MVAEVKRGTPSEFKDDKFPTELPRVLIQQYLCNKNQLFVKWDCASLAFKKICIFYRTWSWHGPDISEASEWDFAPALAFGWLSLFVQQTTLLSGHSGHWSPLASNLLIDFHCCVAWDRSGVSILHGIVGVIVLQRLWVWNLSSLMHQSALVSSLPKHDGERMDVSWIGCFWWRSNSSFHVIMRVAREVTSSVKSK